MPQPSSACNGLPAIFADELLSFPGPEDRGMSAFRSKAAKAIGFDLWQSS
jgi:hypothetical protein